MTNHWIDLKNADVILVMGANPASNHPISMKWIMQAKQRGATLICVDPRFTQTAAVSDLYAPIRSGTDIAFLGGMINYLLSNDLYFREYVANYTDAPFLVHADFKMPGELDGVFSGYDEKDSKYDRTTWSYQLDDKGVPRTDPTMKDPNCVFQLLKKHYARYTVDKVSQITGTPTDKCEAVYKAIGSTSRPIRTATACYAMGWTQHTVGVQNIRAFTIVQLLLGNMGMAGAIFNDNPMDLEKLLTDGGKEQAIERVSAETGIDRKILSFLIQNSIKPSIEAGMERLCREIEPETWRKPHCPVCGCPPALNVLKGEAGERFSICSYCSCQWRIDRLSCAACGNKEQDSLRYFHAVGEDAYRIDMCNQCRHYIKTIDYRNLETSDPCLEDLATLHLDILALQKGYART